IAGPARRRGRDRPSARCDRVARADPHRGQARVPARAGGCGMSASPVLIGCSHGTDSVAGRAAIRSILDDVRALRPELDVREAFVDVQLPEVADVVGEALSDGGVAGSEEGSRGSDAGPVGAVVVPLLLSTGFHVKVDIADSVAGRPAV